MGLTSLRNIFLLQSCKMQEYFIKKWPRCSALTLDLLYRESSTSLNVEHLTWSDLSVLPQSGGSISAWLEAREAASQTERSNLGALWPFLSLQPFIPCSDPGDGEKQPSEACCWNSSEDISSQVLSSNELHITSFWAILIHIQLSGFLQNFEQSRTIAYLIRHTTYLH